MNNKIHRSNILYLINNRIFIQISYKLIHMINNRYLKLPGFSTGYLHWDDEDGNNENSHGGILPDGSYTTNTDIYYCCRYQYVKRRYLLLLQVCTNADIYCRYLRTLKSTTNAVIYERQYLIFTKFFEHRYYMFILLLISNIDILFCCKQVFTSEGDFSAHRISKVIAATWIF